MDYWFFMVIQGIEDLGDLGNFFKVAGSTEGFHLHPGRLKSTALD